MDFNDLMEYNRLLDSADHFYSHALTLVCEQKYLEAKCYFLDAYSYYEKAEIIAFKNRNDSLVSLVKAKKEKTIKEAEECINLYNQYDLGEFEL